MRNKDQILLENIYNSIYEDRKWYGTFYDMETISAETFHIHTKTGESDLTYEDMVDEGYNFYVAYFHPMSFHEGFAAVTFIRSEERPEKDIKDRHDNIIKPWEWQPLFDKELFQKDIEKALNDWNKYEMEAIEMDNPRVKGWGN